MTRIFASYGGFFLLLFIALTACSAPSVPPVSTPVLSEIVDPSSTPEPTATATRTATPMPTSTKTPAPTATPFITPPTAGEKVDIPILMYHHLKYEQPGTSVAIKTWSVAPDQFAAQLDMLQARGFQTITFKQLVEFFGSGKPLPNKPILLTFDDGWIDDYTVAFPELTKRGMVGNFFAPTRYLNAGGTQLISWDQALEMDRAGMEFGGHTINHEDLTKMNLDVLQKELIDSKKVLEDKLGHPIYALSYPFGAFNPKVMAETAQAGYSAAVILCCGYKQSADILFALPRIRVSYDDTLQQIAAKLP